MDQVIFLRLFLALALGTVIGLEREFEFQKGKRRDFGGIRTFVLLVTLGAFVGYLSERLVISSLFVILSFITVSLLVITSYVVVSLKTKKIGATTELAALITFLIGICVMKGYYIFAIIVCIITTAVLAFKPQLHFFARQIKYEELYASLKFGIISLVVLPLLPNKAYALTQIPGIGTTLTNAPRLAQFLSDISVFNPFKIWLMVVFITGISYVGYLLMKQIGANKGLGITGFLGGLVSSTAVTSSLALESKRHKGIVRPFTIGVLIASCTMFARVLFEVFVLNITLLPTLVIPLGIMIITGLGITCFFYYMHIRKKKVVRKDITFKTPFALLPALKFGIFFAFVLFAVNVLEKLFGTSGLYLAAAIAGLADVDAITISMATLAAAGTISIPVAITTITIAVCSNMFVKAGIVYFFGDRAFARELIWCLALILGVGLLALAFV